MGVTQPSGQRTTQWQSNSQTVKQSNSQTVKQSNSQTVKQSNSQTVKRSERKDSGRAKPCQPNWAQGEHHRQMKPCVTVVREVLHVAVLQKYYTVVSSLTTLDGITTDIMYLWPPIPEITRLVGDGGPITGCLIHKITKYSKFQDFFPSPTLSQQIVIIQIGLN